MKAIVNGYKEFSRISNALVRLLCIAFFGLMVVDVVASVVMRYILVKPMVWGEQLAVYCMIWVAFLSASIALRRGAHMGLDLVVKAVPARIATWIIALAHLLIIVFLVLLIYWGFVHAHAVRFQRSPVLFNISMFWPYLALPVGGVFMLIQEFGVILNRVEEDII